MPEPRPARLLIVDDSEDNREVLKRRMQRLGYETVEVEGGRQALELIEREPFDLILLDIMMPEMDGLEVLRRIRLTHTSEALPVVMVTAKAMSEDLAGALELGANDYITKPIDAIVAKARVAAQVGRKRADDASREVRQQLEQNLETLRVAVAQSEAAAKAKADFLANMSHEVRTPLNGILGVASVLLEDCEKPAHREMVQIIQDSAKDLNRLLSDVLELTRLEAGKTEILNESFDLAASVRRAARPFEVNAQSKGLSLAVSVARSAKGAVVGDALRVGQILTNLLSNAVKFTETGSITCELSREGTGGYLLEVRDTGIGFDPQLVEVLFERFRQADSETTRKFGGTGLGLAIARDLAELMGGSLTAVSEPGRGSVFSLRLPFNAPSARRSPRGRRKDSAPNAKRSVRVLAADDNEINRRVVELILSTPDFAVTCVEDGAQALAAAADNDFDVILMDIQMPVMDGLKAIRGIRKHAQRSGTPHVPIIVLSANAAPDDMARSRAAGAEQHLGKPIVPSVLLAAIDTALRSAQTQAAPVEHGADRQTGRAERRSR